VLCLQIEKWYRHLAFLSNSFGISL
jgi:hypothetical protein